MKDRISERLKWLREEKGLSQNQLANLTSLNQASINRWEAGQWRPNVDAIITLCLFFGCTAGFLIGLED